MMYTICVYNNIYVLWSGAPGTIVELDGHEIRIVAAFENYIISNYNIL